MSDRIKLEGLEVEAVVGVYPKERLGPQRLIIDVALTLDTRPAALADTLAAALDYDQVAEICRGVAAERLHLIETVADRIASRILAAQPGRIDCVAVRVAKPGAVPGARTVAVEIERRSGGEPKPR